jgi:hypothetical protein
MEKIYLQSDKAKHGAHEEDETSDEEDDIKGT